MEAQSLLLYGPRSLKWVKERIPEPGPREVLIKTRAGAISIGSELPYYQGVARTTETIQYPLMTGYESVGEVIACGVGVQQLVVGDRIVAFYGHRTHAVVAEQTVIRVPEEVSDQLALLSILSCDVSKGIRKIAPRPEEAVIITGLGAIGLLTLFMLRAQGIRHVDAIDPRPERCALAQEMGARHTGLQKLAETYTAGFECANINSAFQTLQESMQRSGRICVLSDGNRETLELTPTFHSKELTIVGSSDGRDYQQHAVWFFSYATEYADILEQLFSLHIGREELLETFVALDSGERTAIKVFVEYA